MAFTDNTTFTGIDAQGFYSKALLTGDTKSMIRLYPDVKSKVKIARLDMTNILQEADCTFTDGGTTTLSQKTLEVCPIKVNLEYCQRTFEANYLSLQLRAGSNTTEVMPTTVEEYILGQVAKNVSADLELLLWQGNTGGSPASICDGLLIQFDNDAAVVDVTGYAALTANNIIEKMGLVYSQVANTVSNSPELVIFVSPGTAKLYKQALAATNNALIGGYNNGDFTLSYINVPVVVAAGLPANVMVCAEKTNLFFGTDLMSDFEDVLIIPQRDKSGAPTVRFVAEFKFGVTYGVSEEIAYYHA